MSTLATSESATEDRGEVLDRSYRLKIDEAPAAGIRRIALGRAEKTAEELSHAQNGNDYASSVHAARKNLKKLRGALRLVRTELGEDLYRVENQRYRDVGRLLSQSRDAEVKASTLQALRERFEGEFPADIGAAWLTALERERDEIAEQISDGDAGALIAEATAAIADGREEISAWPMKRDSWKLVEAGLLRSYRGARRAMKRTRSDPEAENVHEWRKRVKDLWYQLRILHNAWPSVISETAEQAHQLAELLGDHHDLAVLAEDLAVRQIPGERKVVGDLIDRRQRELLGRAFEIGVRLLAEKPKAFERRFESYWLAWRPR